jgi:hypothetical protein
LTLMGGALPDTLKEGESKTYELNGKKYEVNVLIIADSGNNVIKVKLMINGQVTNSLGAGETDTLDDGTVIGIRDVLSQGNANGSDLVAFYLGANKIVLDGAAHTVKVDDTSIQDVNVSITGSTSGTDDSISKLSFTTVASDTTYMTEGKKLSTYLRDKEAMISDQWDMMFTGLTQPARSEVALTPSGNSKYYLSFTSQDGFDYKISLLERDSTGAVVVGRTNGDALIYQENVSIAKKDSFIVSKKSAKFQANTHVLKLSDINNAESELTIDDQSTGNSASYKLKYDPAAPIIVDSKSVFATTAPLTVGGDDYNVYVLNNSGAAPTGILIDLDGDGSVTGNGPTGIGAPANIITKGSVNVSMTLATTTGTGDAMVGNLTFKVDPNLEQDGLTTPSAAPWVNITAVKSKEMDVALGGLPTANDDGSDDQKAMNQYGIQAVDLYNKDGADTVKLSIPTDQVFYNVYVVGNDVKTSSTASGNTQSVYQKIEVGAAVLDSEVSSVSADNLIVVGGPCANTIAASLLGISNSMPACYENFPVKEGQGIIKMVENGAKVATVVAGYSAADTRKAAQVLANYESNAAGLTGKSEVVVSGSKISAPEVVAAAGNNTNSTG